MNAKFETADVRLHRRRVLGVHVGAHKTGTTTVQRLMKQFARFFSYRGIDTLQRFADAGGAHHQLAFAIAEQDNDMIATCGEVLGAGGCVRGLLSSEVFCSEIFGNPDSQAVLGRALRHIAERADMHLCLMYMHRDPASYAVSCYRQSVKTKETKPFVAWLPDWAKRHDPYASLDGLLRLDPAPRIVALPYQGDPERFAATVAEMMHQTYGLDGTPFGLRVSGIHENRSLSGPQVEAIRRLHIASIIEADDEDEVLATAPRLHGFVKAVSLRATACDEAVDPEVVRCLSEYVALDVSRREAFRAEHGDLLPVEHVTVDGIRRAAARLEFRSEDVMAILSRATILAAKEEAVPAAAAPAVAAIRPEVADELVEMISGKARFVPEQYLALYPELKGTEAESNPMRHYVDWGIIEGRLSGAVAVSKAGQSEGDHPPGQPTTDAEPATA